MSLSAFTGGRAPLYIKASDLMQAMHTMPSIPPEKHEAACLACLAEEARLVAVAAPEAEAPAPDLAEPQVRFVACTFCAWVLSYAVVDFLFVILVHVFFVPQDPLEDQMERLLQQPTKIAACLQAGVFFSAPSWQLKLANMLTVGTRQVQLIADTLIDRLHIDAEIPPEHAKDVQHCVRTMFMAAV